MQGRAGRQISRPRPCLSCSTCRRRKVRCGRESPECYNCVRLREPCHYDQFQSKDPPVQSSATSVTAQSGRPEDGQTEGQCLQEDARRRSSVPDNAWNDWPTEQNEMDSARVGESEASASTASTARGPMSSPTPPVPKPRPELHISHLPNVDPASKSRSAPLSPTIRSAASNANAVGYSWDMDAIISDSMGLRQDLSGSMEDLEGADLRRKRQRQSPKLPTSSELSTESIRRDFASPFNLQTAYPKRSSNSAFTEEEVAHSGYLAQRHQPRPQYVEPTFWALISGHESLCEDLFRSQVDNIAINAPFAPIDPVGMAKILRLLPNRVKCDALLLSFMIGVRPIAPLIHVPSFREDYTQFWNWAAKSDVVKTPSLKLIRDPTFFPLLFAILFSGAIAAPAALWNQSPFQGVDKDLFVNELESACRNSLRICQYNDYPTISTLVASLLWHSCCKQNSKRLETSSYIRQAIRSAQNLGLHDESVVEGTDTAIDVRRRIWGHIMWLDVQDSIMNGSRISSGSNDIDQVSPTTSRPFTYPTPPLQTIDNRQSTVAHFTRGFYETTLFEHSLMLALQHHRRPPCQIDFEHFLGKLKRLHITLDLLISKIPANGIPEKGYIPARVANASPLTDKDMYCDTGAGPNVFSSWARIKLTMLKAEAAILLQKAALGNADVRTREGKKKWQSIVQLCVHYLRNFLQLTRVPAFSPYHWFLSACQHPLQPIVIILIYLHHDPASPTAQVTRYFIDEVIDVFTSHEISPASKSGQSSTGVTKSELSVAWEFVKALRARLDLNIADPGQRNISQREQNRPAVEQVSSPQSVFSARLGNDGFAGLREMQPFANSEFDTSSSWLDSALGDDVFGGRNDPAKHDLQVEATSWTRSEAMQSPMYKNQSEHDSQSRRDGERGEDDTDGQISMAGESDFLSNWVSNGDLGFESLLDGV